MGTRKCWWSTSGKTPKGWWHLGTGGEDASSSVPGGPRPRVGSRGGEWGILSEAMGPLLHSTPAAHGSLLFLGLCPGDMAVLQDS